jgi:hypothetical protein
MSKASNSVAVHEAGHAVVVLIEGLWFVDVVMPGTLSTDCDFANLRGGLELIRTDPNWTLEADLRQALAGPLAERRVAAHADYEERVEAHVTPYRSQLRDVGADPAAAIEQSAERVDAYFDNVLVWGAVEAVAEVLATAKRLSVDDARRLVIDVLGDHSYPIREQVPPLPGMDHLRRSIFEKWDD